MPFPSVVSLTEYEAEVVDVAEEAVVPEPAEDALRITARPFDVGGDTVRVVALAPVGGVIGLPPNAALAVSGTSRELENASAEATTARLKRIDMV
ncbi:conserved hypothetical protein [Paraburkholderia sabiae]|nr:conserved hypothetical protein [Paraburkholderia sabiae]